jgi:hypothetical protein
MKYVRVNKISVGEAIHTYGIDYGGPIYCHSTCGDNVVIRKPAYTVWESRGQYGTDPARVMVGTLFHSKESGSLWVSFFWEKETGRQWRTVMAEAEKVAIDKTGEIPAWGVRLKYSEFPF